MPNSKKKIGKYEIVSILGKGAMGVVYKARDPIIDRLVAIKTQHLDIPDAENLRLDERFITEARAAGRLSHPNIIGLYDFGQDGDCSYIVMELATGNSLSDYVNRKRPITLDEIWDTILKVLDGLQYAHDSNVIHRDIKPANILRDESGNVKITDFGIAQVDTSNLTNTGCLIGTPRYMSPERVKGEKGDQRADIYACGVLLHELLTGQPAFRDENSASIIYKIISTELPPVSESRPDCPKGMDAVIAKSVAKDPEERYLTARDFADEILKVLDESKTVVVDSNIDTDTDSDETVLQRVPVNLSTEAQAPAAQDGQFATSTQEGGSASSTQENASTPSTREDESAALTQEFDSAPLTYEGKFTPSEESLAVSGESFTTEKRGLKKWVWIAPLIIFIVIVVVWNSLQVSKDDPGSEDISLVNTPKKPPEEVATTVDKTSAESPLFKPERGSESEQQKSGESELFSKIKTGAIFSDCPGCPTMIVAPAGEWSLGSMQNREEQPIHLVNFSRPFAVAQFEISRGEFAKFVSATNYSAKGCLTYENNEWLHREQRDWQSPGYIQDDSHPVVCVSWVDATQYISWLSELTGKEYRLLSSSEWEYLARRGLDRNEIRNDSLKEICQFANVADESAQKEYPGWVVHNCDDHYVHTAPANTTSFEPDPLGVSGLLGNAFEWVSDCWSAGYETAPSDGSANLTGDCTLRILRGGSWFSQPDYVRFGFENRFDSNTRASTFGFRIARGLHPDEVIPAAGEIEK